MTHNLKDPSRKDIQLFSPQIEEVLPEYFSEQYTTTIDLLKHYYEFLDSDGRFNFVDDIYNAFSIRDIISADNDYLDQILSELGQGITRNSFRADPKLCAQLLADLFRKKGTRYSAERFFRAFFNEEVSVEYPKKNIFIVGESQIGAESVRFLINNREYQTFSILLKLGLPTFYYETLYKKYIHPAGFYFLGVIQTQTEVNLTTEAVGANVFDSAERVYLISEAGLGFRTEYADLTALFDSADGGQNRATLIERISEYKNLTWVQLANFYGDIRTWYTPNSFTFDDSSARPRPDLSMTFETMDNAWFTRIGSDSSY